MSAQLRRGLLLCIGALVACGPGEPPTRTVPTPDPVADTVETGSEDSAGSASGHTGRPGPTGATGLAASDSGGVGATADTGRAGASAVTGGTADTADAAGTADTGAEQTGETGSASATADTGGVDTGGPVLRVLPDCDIGVVASRAGPPVVDGHGMRFAWITGAHRDPGGSWLGGLYIRSISAMGRTQVFLNSHLLGATNPSDVVVQSPISGDAPRHARIKRGFDASTVRYAFGDLAGTGRPQVLPLHDKRPVLPGSPSPLAVIDLPVPPGTRDQSALSLATIDMWDVPLADYTHGGLVEDWDGDGQDDLLVFWDDGNRISQGDLVDDPEDLSYPIAGAAVYLGPVPASGLEPLVTPADAVYDITAWDDTYNCGGYRPRGSGSPVTFVPDVDGDGRPELFMRATCWPSGTLPRSGSSFENRGGWVLVPGGKPGVNDLGDVRLALGNTCAPNRLNMVQGDLDVPFGDIDGDGRADVPIVLEDIEIDGTPRSVLFVVTRLELQGTYTLAEASGLMVVGGFAGQVSLSSLISPTSLGDLDGNGYDDFAIAQNDTGEVHVFMMPVSGVVDTSYASLTLVRGAGFREHWGDAIGSADLDEDGLLDLLISDPAAKSGRGEVDVISGAALLTAMGL